MLGGRVARREDFALLTGQGTYVANVCDDLLAGAVYATFVRSISAHALVNDVDLREARAQPGVVAAFSGRDLDIGPVPPTMPNFPASMAQSLVATDRVRYVGEPVAVLLTEEPSQGEDAADLVVVDYDPLPAVVDPQAAAQDDTLLFPDAGTNTVVSYGSDPDPALFSGCDVVVTTVISGQRLAPCPLEGRSAASAWDRDGRLHHWVSTQAPHASRRSLATLLGLEEDRVRVVAPDVGGGFGAKYGSYPEDLTLPWLARRVARPVRWTETRRESMVGLAHGRGQRQVLTIGARRDGRVMAYFLDILQDAGAYPLLGAYVPSATLRMACGVYDIPRVHVRARAVVTNTTPVTTYRGAGRPEAAAAIERAIDRLAAELGLDPVDVRRRNVVPQSAFPFRTPLGTTYDCGAYEEALDRVTAAGDYAALRAEQRRRRASRSARQLGIGVSLYVESTAGPTPFPEFGSVSVDRDAGVTVRCGTAPHGQGHATSFAMIVGDRLGIPMGRIAVEMGDTDVVPQGFGTFGSRSLQTGGVALLYAADEVLTRARGVVAELLEANVDDVVLDPDRGLFHVAGSPSPALSWAEIVDHAGAHLQADVTHTPSAPTYPFGCHLAVVALDPETGRCDLEQFIALDDAGTIVNPLLAEGQRHGGIAQGIAQVLFEEVAYDDAGNPLTSTLADYALVSAADLISFDLITMETPTPVNPLGAKGIGESGTTGALAAVQNAVYDALAPFGVTHIELPASPRRVWAALRMAETRPN